MRTLPDLLGSPELPSPELQAARLDGELYALGDGWAAVDRIETPALRLAGALRGRSPRLIAELGTAAWVWGVVPTPPTTWELCVVTGERISDAFDPRARIRQVVADGGDVVDLDGFRVTSMLRTAVDLARADACDPLLLATLVARGQVTLDDADALMDRRRNLPGKRRARHRLAEAVAAGRGAR